MRRMVLVSTAAAAVAATVAPVHAGSAPLDAGRIAVADLTFHFSHGRTLSLELRAGALSSGNVLRVLEQRCYSSGRCDASTTAYQSPVAADALTVDANNPDADLRMTVAGHALHIRWQPGASNVEEVGGFEAQGGSLSTSGSDYEGAPAITAVELDGTACAGHGAVGTGAFADTSAATGGPDDAPLSELRIPSRGTLTCG